MGPAINWVPRTPRHCPVCGTVVPKVEDPDYRLRSWARHLNYVKHLKETHSDFYAWNKKWDVVKYLPIAPSFVVFAIAVWERDASLLLVAGLLFLILLLPLYAYRRTRVRRFQDSWREGSPTPTG